MDIINLNDTSNKLYYIGGIVRDFLLNRHSFDVDITYEGNALEYCTQFGEIIQKNPEFGTVRALVDGKEVDFASTRTEKYLKKGHLPQVDKLGVPLKDDVMRRDFTINALAMSVTTGKIVDYVGGVKDLKARKLRVLHNESFIDDPTRIIRGLKFAMRFGFELEDYTKELQNEYLKNINYDMSFKRVKKELIETFGLVGHDGLQNAYEKFILDGIYKLITPQKVSLPEVDIGKLVNKYSSLIEYQWLIFVGTIGDLSRLPLTKIEQKILNDVPQNEFKNDFEIYKAFENKHIESVLLYGILHNENTARKYLDYLRDIKITVNGNDLKSLGLKPSAKFTQYLDYVLKEKLKNPTLTHEEELRLLNEITS